MRVLSFTLLLSLILTLPLFASNSVSGTWTEDDSPIVIEEDSYVPVGEQLTIEAGVLIKFHAGTRLEVYGQIVVEGAPKNPVVFTGFAEDTVWDGLFIYGTDEGLPNTFTHAHILNCVYGMSVDAGISYLSHVTIKADYYALLLRHNAYARAYDCVMNVTTTNSDAITVFSYESQFDALRSTFELNIQLTTNNPSTAAVKLRFSEADLDSCHIQATSRSGAHGVHLLACYDNVNIQRSSIHVSHFSGATDESCAAIYAMDSNLSALDHMSIHLETDSGSIYGIYATQTSSIELINSVIAATNVVSGTQRYAAYIEPNGYHGSVHFSYSLIHQVTLDNNTQFFSYDEFSMLVADPLWLDPGQQDYHLMEGSPCIDSGSPASEPDPDDTVADLGRHHYTPISSVVEGDVSVANEFTLSTAYPNPFNAGTRFSLELPEASEIEIRVQNVLGQSVAVLANGCFRAGHHDFTWQPDRNSNLASGIYLLHVRANGAVQSQRLVLLK